MNNLRPKKLIAFAFLQLSCLWPLFCVKAQTEGIVTPANQADQATNQFKNWCQVNYPNFDCGSLPSLGQYISYLYNLAVYAVAIVVIFIMVREGFSYFLNSGNPGKSKEAKEKIYAAFLGLIILLAGSLIISIINPRLNTLNLNIQPIKYNYKQIKAQDRIIITKYLAIPIGEIITEATFSPNFMRSIARGADDAEKLKSGSKKIQPLVEELYSQMEACTCTKSRCLDANAPCNNATIAASNCDKQKIASLRQEISDLLDKQEDSIANSKTELKKRGRGFETPRSSLQQITSLLSLLNLADSINLVGYYDFLALREDAGKNIKIYYDTEPFSAWQQLFNRKPFDPTVFYLNKDESSLAIAQAEKINKSINVDPIKNKADFDGKDQGSQKDETTGEEQPPGEIVKIFSKDYPAWLQGANPWGDCAIGINGVNPQWQNGCANTSLSMAIAYWYKHNQITRENWLSLVKKNPPPGTMAAISGTCSRPNGDAPDPYRVLYYLNYYGINEQYSTWNEDNLVDHLNSLNLGFQPLYTKSFDGIKYQLTNLGRSVLLFCDVFGYGRSYRAYRNYCYEGINAFPCNHYVLAKSADEKNIYINDPAGWETSLSREDFEKFRCGVVLGEDMSFAIYPIKWK